MIFWVITFYAVYEGMGSKRKGRRELLKNELPTNTWGKNGIVHRAEGMPVLGFVGKLTSRNWNLERGLKGTPASKQEENLLLAVERSSNNIEWHPI